MLKVLMLGDSQVGKTTYMGAMYNVMADGEGYHIRATYDGERETLERLGRLVRHGGYPERTAVRSDYDFKFCLKYENTTFDMIDFRWIDYRGGAIYQTTDDPIARDLAAYIENASALIVFWDTTLLNSSRPNVLRQWRRIAQFIMKFAARANEKNPLSLTILLTKADLFDGDDWTETVVGRKIFEFIKTFSGNSYLHGMLAFSAINRNSEGNVLFPFVHSMRFGLNAEIKRLYDEYMGRSFWGDLWAGLTGDALKNRLESMKIILNDLSEKLKENDGSGYMLF